MNIIDNGGIVDNFLKWVKNTFDTSLPNDYLQFLLSDDENSILGKSFQFYKNDKLTSTDIHYVFKIQKSVINSIEWNYNNYFSEEIIPAFLLPIAEDSGGNLICLNMSAEKYSQIYFVLHDNFEMTYYFVANNFSEWCLKMYSQQTDRLKVESNVNTKFKEHSDNINSEPITRDCLDMSLSVVPSGNLESFKANEKMELPVSLCDFYHLIDGREVNKKIEFICKKSKTKFSVEIPTVLPFCKAEKMYYELIKRESTMVDYFPIAVSSNVNFMSLVKVRKRNKGKIYFYNAFNRNIIEAYDSVEDFFRELGIDIPY